MALETGTYISDLVVTNPPGTDPKSQMDDHLRLIKSTIKNTFPNVTGAVSKTQAELNSVTDRGLIAGQTWTGPHQFPATTYGVTAAFGASGTQYATLDYVNAVATNAALPGQTLGLLTSNGTTAGWTKNLTFGLNEAKAADVASSAVPDIWSGNGNTMHITGVTTLTGFAAAPQAGAWRKLVFDGACLLTNSASFIVQGGINYTTSAGDIIWVFADTTTKFYLLIDKASGGSLAKQNLLCTATLTKTSDTVLATIPGFTATLVSGATYKFSVMAFTDSVAAGGIKFGFSGTATATSFIAALQEGDTGASYATPRTASLAGTLGSAGSIGAISPINGIFVCNAGGTFIIQFAQTTSNVTPSSVLANSLFTVERIS